MPLALWFLGIDAFIGKQWGFVLLEGVWSIVAIQGLFKYFNKNKVKQKYSLHIFNYVNYIFL